MTLNGIFEHKIKKTKIVSEDRHFLFLATNVGPQVFSWPSRNGMVAIRMFPDDRRGTANEDLI